MYKYDSGFYDYINRGSLRSAEQIIPLVKKYFDVKSVVDFGCGQGAWLSVWSSHGVPDCIGIDGEYVDRDGLLIDAEKFCGQDISKEIDLGQSFDLVQSLEVAEHLPASAADTFVANLVRHGDVILFSAAVPGQGGENHKNEQPYEYWREIFGRYGYVAVDLLRPDIKSNAEIESWYRFNSLIYVNNEKIQQCSQEIQQQVIGTNDAIKDVSPAGYKLRKLLLTLLPTSVATMFARIKARLTIVLRYFSNKN